jgi:methionyl-tRNA formyltransferase
MKIIFAGTPDFAANILKILIASQHQICAVYTQPDKKAGRGKKIKQGPTKMLALSHDLPIYQPINFIKPQDVKTFKDHKSDICIVAAYGLLLPKEILEAPKLGCINVHPSLLPKYRGASPISAAILNADNKTGTSIMQMNEKLDAGDILKIATLPIEPCDTTTTLHNKLSKQGGKLLLTTLDDIIHNNISATKQDDTKASYATKLSKAQGKINWSDNAQIINQQIKAFNPYPISWCYYKKLPIRIHKAQIYDNNKTGEAGKITKVCKNKFLVQTGKGILNIKIIQFPSKKPTDTNALINSYNFANDTLY